MGRYVTVADIRAEGGSTFVEPDDSRVESRIALVEDKAERDTGTWWESRPKTYRLDGLGGFTLPLPQWVISITSVSVDGSALAAADYVLEDGFMLDRVAGRFTRGHRNVVVVGAFGLLSNGVCPPAVKRALIQRVIDLLPKAGDADAALDRRTATATSISVAGRTTGLASVSAPWSGNPEVDSVLAMYRRPAGAAVL